MLDSNRDNIFLDYCPGTHVGALYTLSIEYLAGGHIEEDFQRVVEVASDMSLCALHFLVQHLTGFHHEEINGFYVAASLSRLLKFVHV